MSFEVELLRDASTLSSLESQWVALARADPKPTWFQKPDFVLPWYQHYSAVYEPLVIVGRKNNNLVGLLAAAVDRRSGDVVHAGTHHATYHGWIAHPSVEGKFPVAAVEAVFEALDIRRWEWRFLPPGAPIHWSDRSRSARRPLDVERTMEAVPVWDLTEADAMRRRVKKKRLRNYMNRYRREGDFSIGRVTDPELAARYLEVASAWVDLRIGSHFGVLPFADDPRKLKFHQAWIRQSDNAYLTAMTLNGRLLALELDVIDRGRLCLSLHAHDPFEGQSSVGTILTTQVGRTLSEAGCQEVDLTPGAQSSSSWKHQFATSYRDSVSLEFFRSKREGTRQKVLSRISSEVRRTILRAGKEPKELKTQAKESLSNVRRWIRREPSSPPRLYELTVASELADPPELAPHHERVAKILSADSHLARPQVQRLCQEAILRLQNRWTPHVAPQQQELGFLAWLEPPSDQPRALKTAAQPLHESTSDALGALQVPEDAAIVIVSYEQDGLDVERALNHLTAQVAARGQKRVWLLFGQVHHATERWLAGRGRRVV